uniref:Uncharacterized protein n=1 Tax=Nymphaea colorata TaxID=210225 RepID=A0A5K1F291_9MAGN|nr:unnamed protein product [Nymphaea colorata]
MGDLEVAQQLSEEHVRLEFDGSRLRFIWQNWKGEEIFRCNATPRCGFVEQDDDWIYPPGTTLGSNETV